jgi:tRNA 2-selenouridine synthase
MLDFSSYDLIIDARSPREYAEDHIPGAINLPVVDNDEYAEVGTLHRTDPMAAYQIGVAYSLKNIARYLQTDIAKYPRKSRILIYCFRGGKRSRLWFDALDTIGYRVERIPGGWKAYRRWVNAQLAELPARFRYLVLSGPTGCGKTRLLWALERAGAQVLDLEGLAVHRGSVIGAVPGKTQPTQKLFDSFLLRKLSGFDADKPIWVEAESKKIGRVQLPEALLARMRECTTLFIDASMEQRVKLWREDYRHFEEDPQALLTQLAYLRPLVGGPEYEEWQRFADEGQMPELFEHLMRNYYDPLYRRSTLRNYPDIDKSPRVLLEDLSPEALVEKAQAMRKQFEAANLQTQ